MSRNERGVYISPDGKKTFVPLENNPEVFTELLHKLGVSTDLGFYDIYSIDEPDLVALIPKPVHAIIFISPADVWHRTRAGDTAAGHGTKELTYQGAGAAEPVIWFKQTIGHACGLIALLHSIANGSAKQHIIPGSIIDDIIKQAIPLKAEPRAKVLYDSDALERAHMSVAFKGDSKAPLAAEPNGYHFISFVKGDNNHLYELEGGWNGPIDLGDLGDDDVLSEKALDAGIRRYIRGAEGNVEFSMIALSTTQDA